MSSSETSLPLTHETFVRQIAAHLATIEAQRADLLQASTPFKELGEVWPDQCESALAALVRLAEALDPLAALFKQRHPFFALGADYGLMNQVYHLQERVESVQVDLTVFRRQCRTLSRTVLLTQQRLVRDLKKVWEEMEQLAPEYAQMCSTLEQYPPDLLDVSQSYQRRRSWTPEPHPRLRVLKSESAPSLDKESEEHHEHPS